MLKKELSTKIVLQLFSPIVITLILIIILYFVLDDRLFYSIVGIAGLSLFAFLGKFAILVGIMQPFHLHPLIAAMTIAYLDIILGIFFIMNFDWLYRAPFFGEKMKKLEKKGKSLMLKYKWVEKLAFWGLVLFVIFPASGTGAIGATFIGKFIGMKPNLILYAIILGASIGCLGIAYFGHAIKILFQYDKVLGITIFGFIAILLILLYYRKDIKLKKNN